MIGNPHRCLATLVDGLIDEVRPETGEDQRAMVRAYVLATVGAMPDYLRLAFMGLALLFDGWSLPLHGQRFHRLGRAQRLRQIAAWRGSRLGFRRSFVAFFTTFVAFGLYSEVYGQDYADIRAHAA